MCLDEETFCTLLMELMELELSLPRPSSVTISSTIFLKRTSSIPVPSKLELVPELETFSSVTQHHCWFTRKIQSDHSLMLQEDQVMPPRRVLRSATLFRCRPGMTMND